MKERTFQDNDGVMHMVKLDNCPHCGHLPKITPIGNSHTKSRKVEIKCSNRGNCGNKGFTVAAIYQGFDFCVANAAKQWNKRV